MGVKNLKKIMEMRNIGNKELSEASGLRPGEVCALQWSDIDLKAKTITISRALKSDGIIRNSPKKISLK